MHAVIVTAGGEATLNPACIHKSWGVFQCPKTLGAQIDIIIGYTFVDLDAYNIIVKLLL